MMSSQIGFASGLPVVDVKHILNTIISEIERAADFALDQIAQANQLKELVTSSNELIGQTGLLTDIKDVYGNAKRVYFKLGRINDELGYLHNDVLSIYGGFMGDTDAALYEKLFGYLDSDNNYYTAPKDIYAPEKEYRSRTVEITGTLGEDLTDYRRGLEQDIIETMGELQAAETDQEIQKLGKKLDGLTAMLLAASAEESKAYHRAMITNASAEVQQREMMKARDQRNISAKNVTNINAGTGLKDTSKEFSAIRKTLADKVN
jgi:hypothetical protein